MKTIEPTIKQWGSFEEMVRHVDYDYGYRLHQMLMEERLMAAAQARGRFVDPRFSRISQNKVREASKKKAHAFMYGEPHLRRDDPVAKAFVCANQPWQFLDLDWNPVEMNEALRMTFEPGIPGEVIVKLQPAPKTFIKPELLRKKVRDW